ncbi:MAG TPA: helix-turn-helix domain-containing protein [Kiritimatiellia bacterium]|nr:helix-turn-helix domain-containing protein [Kiritimatiellia bacterium]HQQ05219.1 helix-turn-helix domain-containing protein [Kiritimatiellia bacterium]
MANVMNVLKSEIVRLARKEAKSETAPARRIMAAQRGLIADLRRQVGAMQKELNVLKKNVASSGRAVLEKAQPKGRFWITGKGVRALRKKLGLTQADFARLAGVSVPTIVNWESSKGKVSIRRKEIPARLQAMRGMNRRAAAEILGKRKSKRAKA